MAASQARPPSRFLTAPLLAAKRVDVRPCLDCVAVLHGVHIRPLVGAHQALTCPLAAGISTSLLATPCAQGTQFVGLGSHGSLSLASEFDASGSLSQGWCSAHDRQRSPSFVHVNAQGSTSPTSACILGCTSKPKNVNDPKDHRWVARY